MIELTGWPLISTLTNLLSLITWGFPLFSLAVLAYCIEHYTRFKTLWKLYIISTVFALIYPLGAAFYLWMNGETVPGDHAFFSGILLAGVLIAAYASLQLLTFQKLSLGKTKTTMQVLAIVSVAVPLTATVLGVIRPESAIYLIGYNLSVSAMIFICISIGKLTQDYIPRYRLLAYNSARLASSLLIIDPLLLNYSYISNMGLILRHSTRFAGAMTQLLAIMLLTIPVIMLIMEAQTRGIHLIPADERKNKNPMRYRLRKGYSYILPEETPTQSMEIFTEYVTHGHHGLLLTRTQPSRVRYTYNLRTTPVLWMTNAQTDEKAVKPKDIDRMTYIIKDFVRFDTDSIILIQRLDYLITENDFNAVLKFIHSLNDLITSTKCILLVSLDPSTLSKDRMAMLLQELEDLTNAEKISLGEPLYSLLLFVYTENSRRKTPSFKSITRKFLITKTTARKRIYELESKGLLRIINDGRYKFLEATDKGRAIVSSPASINEGGGDEE